MRRLQAGAFIVWSFSSVSCLVAVCFSFGGLTGAQRELSGSASYFRPVFCQISDLRPTLMCGVDGVKLCYCQKILPCASTFIVFVIAVLEEQQQHQYSRKERRLN